jgi:hypothetical protein
MTNNILNRSPYLRTSRNFPIDPQPLAVEINKSYVDIANAVNARTIGIFAPMPSNTGNAWYLAGRSSKQETIRQVYLVTGAGTIAHGINVATIGGFVAVYGTFTDGTVWYPLPYVDATAANNQVSLTVTSSNIVITAGGGSPPTISSGYVVLEWLSQP